MMKGSGIDFRFLWHPVHGRSEAISVLFINMEISNERKELL
jgi:hypothetical protein